MTAPRATGHAGARRARRRAAPEGARRAERARARRDERAPVGHRPVAARRDARRAAGRALRPRLDRPRARRARRRRRCRRRSSAPRRRGASALVRLPADAHRPDAAMLDAGADGIVLAARRAPPRRRRPRSRGVAHPPDGHARLRPAAAEPGRRGAATPPRRRVGCRSRRAGACSAPAEIAAVHGHRRARRRHAPTSRSRWASRSTRDAPQLLRRASTAVRRAARAAGVALRRRRARRTPPRRPRRRPVDPRLPTRGLRGRRRLAAAWLRAGARTRTRSRRDRVPQARAVWHAPARVGGGARHGVGDAARIERDGERAIRRYSPSSTAGSPPSFLVDERDDRRAPPSGWTTSCASTSRSPRSRCAASPRAQRATLRDLELETLPGVTLGHRHIPVGTRRRLRARAAATRCWPRRS